MEIKRKPLLIDRFLASPQESKSNIWLSANQQRVIRDRMMTARRFVFDDQASGYLSEMMSTMPEEIANGQQFAIPPFDCMWVEFSFQALIQKLETDETPNGSDPDVMIGYLYLKPDVYVIASNTGHTTEAPKLLPIKYKLFQPFDIERENTFIRKAGIKNRTELDVFFWGSVAATITGHRVRSDLYHSIQTLEAEKLRILYSLREYHSVELLTNIDHTNVDFWTEQKQAEVYAELFNVFTHASAGDLRNITSTLIFLNQTSKVQYIEEVGHKSGMIHNKARNFLSHSIVKIKLNPLPQIKVLGGHGGSWRKRHEVRGHFCLNKIARRAELSGHDHVWVEQSEKKVQQWKCMGCGGLKWHKKTHMRGSLEKGAVATRYEVTE